MSGWLRAFFSLIILLGRGCHVDGRKLLVGSSELTHFFYLGAPDSRPKPAFKTDNVGDEGNDWEECLLEVLIRFRTPFSFKNTDTCGVFSFFYLAHGHREAFARCLRNYKIQPDRGKMLGTMTADSAWLATSLLRVYKKLTRDTGGQSGCSSIRCCHHFRQNGKYGRQHQAFYHRAPRPTQSNLSK